MSEAPPAPAVAGRRVSLAIWASWDVPVGFATEGMNRVVAFLVEGAAVSRRVTLHVCVRPVNEAPARAMLEALRAKEGEDWTLHVIQDDAYRGLRHRLTPYAKSMLALSDRRMGQALFAAGLLALPFLMARTLLRPVWRLALKSGLRLAVAALRDPMQAVPAITSGLRRLRLSAMVRFANELDRWAQIRRAQLEPRKAYLSVAAPTSGLIGARHGASVLARPVRVAGLDPARVDAWLSLMSNMIVPPALPGRRAMMLPDALMLDFGSNWTRRDTLPDGWMTNWLRLVKQNAETSSAIVTFSAHVARQHGVERLGLDPSKMKIVPCAPYDLKPSMPFLAADRRRTPESRLQAATLLRSFARQRDWRYLSDFPLEHVDYVAVSTAERPSKNLSLVVEALRILVQDRFTGTKLLMTTTLHEDPDTPAFRCGKLIRDHGLALDALSVPVLPNSEHAAFYHAAAVTVHASFFEGVDTPLPFSESVSVGTPCIMARGPHTEEMLQRFPRLAPFVFDPYDPEALADSIQDAIARREEILDIQLSVYAQMQKRSWSRVVEEYATAATGIPLTPVETLDGLCREPPLLGDEQVGPARRRIAQQ